MSDADRPRHQLPTRSSPSWTASETGRLSMIRVDPDERRDRAASETGRLLIIRVDPDERRDRAASENGRHAAAI